MKKIVTKKNRLLFCINIFALVIFWGSIANVNVYSAESVKISIHGRGWMQFGRIEKSSDTSRFNYNGNLFQSVAGQITAFANISENWDGALGIGAKQNHLAQSEPSSAVQARLFLDPYISEARFTYYYNTKDNPIFSFTAGYFPFQYNSDTKNLGLYLLRGSIYPGFIYSGFELDETMGIANILGTRFYNRIGNFSHNLIFSSESKIRPLFDYSMSYIAQYQSESFFSMGAGISFYRLFPISSELTTPTNQDLFQLVNTDSITHPYDPPQYYIEKKSDNTGFDTTTLSLAGTKVNAFLSMDFKKLFDISSMGDEDFKLYSEAALIGTKNYKGIYTNMKQRIPIMVGFNVPVYNVMDHLSLEVEWYGAPYSGNAIKLETGYSPIPVSNRNLKRYLVTDSTGTYFQDESKRLPYENQYDMQNLHADDIKWSIHAAKTIKNHVRFSAQVANDHFRTGGKYKVQDYGEAFSTLKDWYWMTKISYFF